MGISGKGFCRFLLMLAFFVFLQLMTGQADAQNVISPGGSDCHIASSAMEIASRFRGLRIVRQVPCRMESRAAVERYLRSTIKKKMSEERIQREGEEYRMLGFIPKDYDYLNKMVELYTEQLGGYYDPERKYYAMADWMPDVIQMPIAVHELTHALQDQHFDLEKLMDHKNQSSDVLLAQSAMIEGDATAVMLDYARGLGGQPSIAEDDSVSMFMIQNISGAMLSPSLRQAPPAIQASLLFPYVSGLNFAHALLKKGGYSQIDRAFKRPPTSTEEILHPDKYLAGEKGFAVLPDPLPPANITLKSDKPVFSDTLGEFFVSTLLGTWIPPQEASAAASGWGGDRLALYEADEKKLVMFWDLLWDADQDAQRFFAALGRAYKRRFQTEPQATERQMVFPNSDFGEVQINLEGKKVSLSIGR
jgi:hypothetical protein